MLNCSFKSIRVDCFCSSVVSVVVMMAVVGRGGVGVWGGVGVDCFLLLLREAWILVVVLKCRYVMCPCMHHQPSSALQPCEWPDTRILSSLSFFFSHLSSFLMSLETVAFAFVLVCFGGLLGIRVMNLRFAVTLEPQTSVHVWVCFRRSCRGWRGGLLRLFQAKRVVQGWSSKHFHSKWSPH